MIRLSGPAHDVYDERFIRGQADAEAAQDAWESAHHPPVGYREPRLSDEERKARQAKVAAEIAYWRDFHYCP